jgi:CRP-like cAMP-binding protein
VLNSKIAKNATFTSLKSKVYLLENDHLALEVDYNHFYHPESFRRKLWGSLLMVIGVYNLIMIPLRLAIRISPVVYLVDYLLDVVLFVNLYLIYFKFYTIRSGILVTDTKVIQSHFFQENFTHHLVAYVPFDILVVFLLTQSTESTLWAMRVIRIPKIFLLFKFPENFSYFEDILSSLKVNYVGSRVIRMLIMVCLIGHWLACIFYLLPTLFNLRRASDCVNEPGAMYGTACQYEGTWIQFQIMTEKLPLDGGDDWARYLRALNWALPLLTLQVLADVLPINNLEFMYSFFGILIGLVVQSSIIGTMISLFAEAQESSDVQIVRKFLEERNVDVDLRMKVLGYLNFLDSPYAHTIMEEESINSELPYSLQLSIIEKTKLQLLSKCPLFDTCTEESKINLCFALTQQIYSDGDYIIKFGDMGHEMFFLAEGSVEVCSDSGVIYTILHAGSYFGETGLVFSDRRMSNIRAMGICVCYCLNRVHLDNELKASSEIDAKTAFATLKSLLERNQRINQAISKNLNRAKVHTSKLSKVIVVEETKPENKFLRALRNPHSNYCIAWDVMGFVALIYYSVAIPFHIGFLHGPDLANYTPFLAIDFFFDLYWAIDIYLRSRYFSIQLMTGKYDSDSNHIWKQYHSSYSFHLDCIASLPLEIFALIPGVPRISLFIFRFVHMIRIRLLFQQIQKIQNHLEHFDFRSIPLSSLSSSHPPRLLRTKRSVIKLITTLIFYFFCNHWFSCGFFMIHRYLESSFSVTWAVADNLAEFDSLRGEHSVCSRSLFHCYSRSIYFVISTLSTVGFGDICPRTNLEFIYQLFVVGLSGLCLNALICSSFLELWNSVDNASHRTYQKHLQIIDHYVKYRKLSFKERNSIVGNFEYLWSTERQSGGYETNFMSK